MPPERRQRLEVLSFVWDPLDVQWEEGFRFLDQYRKDKGDCRVPQRYHDPATGYRLGIWVRTQRQDRDIMPVDRCQRLDALGFVWDPPFAALWEEGFRSLELFRQREEHCLVPNTYRDPASDFRLGQWVATQRNKRNALSPDRRQRLEALGFAWDTFAMQWEEGFRSLECYHQAHGNCRMPQEYCDPLSGYGLGQWSSTQRKNKNTMPPERRQRLDALGFAWDTFAVQWEEGFRCLERYHQAHGNSQVPQRYRDPVSGYRLGGWVCRQRKVQDTLPLEYRQRLDALGFIWNVC